MKEIWKDIPGYEGLYKVSNFGRIKSLNYARQRREGIRSLQQKQNGYLKVDLRRNGQVKTVHVHRLVAEAFIPNPDKKSDVNHKDGNKKNNNVDNLEWVTHIENVQHSKKILKKGGRCPVRVECIETGINYPNMHAAAEAVRSTPSSIKAAVDGTYHTAAGYHWRKTIDIV